MSINNNLSLLSYTPLHEILDDTTTYVFRNYDVLNQDEERKRTRHGTTYPVKQHYQFSCTT